jgi:hypothetical protein
MDAASDIVREHIRGAFVAVGVEDEGQQGQFLMVMLLSAMCTVFVWVHVLCCFVCCLRSRLVRKQKVALTLESLHVNTPSVLVFEDDRVSKEDPVVATALA